MATNLPAYTVQDSAADTKLFFNNYGMPLLGFPSADVDATIIFFKNKGFDESAAIVVAETLLKQARLDGTPIFQLLDSLKGFDSADLSVLVSQILNNNRVNSSVLGFRIANVIPNQSRNISA